MQVRCPLASLYHRMTQSIGTSDNAPYIADGVGEGGLSLRMWSSVFERVLCSKPVTHEYSCVRGCLHAGGVCVDASINFGNCSVPNLVNLVMNVLLWF